MQTTTLVYIIIALLTGAAVAFFQYFYKTTNNNKTTAILFFLRAISVALLVLLFINPKIKTTQLITSKPVLTVLADNSSSINFFKESDNLIKLRESLLGDKSLNKKFEIKSYTFGNNLLLKDSLKFNSTHTNISKVIDEINELYKDNLGGIVLLSDGNQTIGNSYEFLTSKKKVFPVLFGDTIQYSDLELSQINVNKYSYLNNKFPVEAFINYKGISEILARYTIVKNGKNVFSKNLKLSPSNSSITITANIESNNIGTQFYTATISPLKSEKNTRNNTKNFSVEVIDEQQKGAIIASTLHPDIGALKRALERSDKRKIDVFVGDFEKIKTFDYQFFILYQPNNSFNKILNKVESNFLLISGQSTNWNYLNSLDLGFKKEAINQVENYEAFYNANFLTFQQEDIGFNKFPPLNDKFGKLNLSTNSQTLLYQKLTGIQSSEPLLATLENTNRKYAVLFGEGIWKWRANSYTRNNSFDDFDTFLGSLIQYISSNKKRNRLEISYDKIYPANTNIIITAYYLDKNYLFDKRANLWITLTNTKTRTEKKFPLTLVNNAYSVTIENVISGDYSFKITVDNQTISRRGNFKVTEHNVEEQFVNANVSKMKKLANNTKGHLFYKSDFTALKEKLLNDSDFYTVQSTEVTDKNLIDWKWVLFLVVSFLSLEWFIRKYYGKI